MIKQILLITLLGSSSYCLNCWRKKSAAPKSWRLEENIFIRQGQSITPEEHYLTIPDYTHHRTIYPDGKTKFYINDQEVGEREYWFARGIITGRRAAQGRCNILYIQFRCYNKLRL